MSFFSERSQLNKVEDMGYWPRSIRMGIPTWAEDVLLPASTLNVIDLIKFTLPPLENEISLNPTDPSFFSTIPTSIKDARSARILLLLPVPTLVSLKAAQDHVENAGIRGSVSFLLPGVGLRMPFWALDIWEGFHAVDRSQRRWMAAVTFLESLGQEKSGILQVIPWNVRLPLHMGSDVDLLGWYCSTQWLSDTHMDQMAILLEERLRSEGTTTVSTLAIFNVQLLIRTYRYAKDTYSTSTSLRRLRDLGNNLSGGKVMSVVTYVCVQVHSNDLGAEESSLPSMHEDNTGNHWISVILDVSEEENRCLWVGDSKAYGIPEELMEVFAWWLKHHNISEVLHERTMECTTQTDIFSCSVLCHNAIERHFFPSSVSLVPPEDALVERARILGRIVTYLKSVVSFNHEYLREDFFDTNSFRIRPLLARNQVKYPH